MNDNDDPNRIVLNVLPSRGRACVYEASWSYDRRQEATKYAVAKQALEGTHFRSRVLIEIDRKLPFSSAVVDRDALAGIYARLPGLSLRLHPQFDVGFDGAYYHLQIEDRWSYVAVHFWSCHLDSELRPVFEFQRAVADTIDSLVEGPA